MADEATTFNPEGNPGFKRDPNYDLVPRTPQPARKKGIQCGECGATFDYGSAYGYCCPREFCPTQFRTR
jgi:hypothetical protein